MARSLPDVGTSGRLAPLVAMMHAAASRMADDLGIAVRLGGWDSHRPGALSQSEMRSVVMVVRDERGEPPMQVPFIEDNHVVE
jgi:hypothetical protein